MDEKKAVNEANLLSNRQLLLDLEKKINTLIKHSKRKIEKQKSEQKEALKWEWYQQIADSILADPQAVKKTESQAAILNVHSQERVVVHINPRLDAFKNAALYYKKSKKGKRGVAFCNENILRSELELEKTLHLLSLCREISKFETDPDQFLEKFKHLQEILSDKATIPHKLIPDDREKTPFRHYTIKEWDIYIGKNNIQNDELTVHFAKPSDIWLHVAAHSGSHVLIRRNKEAPWPPTEIVEKAASLAVWFSKAKHTSFAEVHITEARFVRKPRKSPPGKVVIQQYKTVRVSPHSPHELFPTF